MKIIFKLTIFFILLNMNLLHGDWNSQDYEETNIGQFKHAIKELSKLSLTGSESILDIGCGDGKTSRYIAKNYIPNGHLVGIDNDESMIALARSHTTDVLNVSFDYADVCTYKTENSFDIVVSFWCLHWVTDYEKALKKISDVLKPGGKALLCHIIDQHQLHPFEVWMQHVLQQSEWQELALEVSTKFNKPSLEKIIEATKKARLTIDYIQIKKNGEWLPLEVFKKNILSTSLFDVIVKEKRAEFCDQVIQGYISENPLNKEGEFFDWLPVVVLVLKK